MTIIKQKREIKTNKKQKKSVKIKIYDIQTKKQGNSEHKTKNKNKKIYQQ